MYKWFSILDANPQRGLLVLKLGFNFKLETENWKLKTENPQHDVKHSSGGKKSWQNRK